MNKQLSHKIIFSIIIFDLVWAAMAAVYDWEIFSRIPIYLWPFLVICPIFPALLSLVWLQSLESRPNKFLLAFGAMPSVVYLFAAIIYYPTWMILNGFDWMTFGAIFWVAAYGLQGLYFLSKYCVERGQLFFVAIFLIFSLTVQYLTKTYGAQDFTNFSQTLFIAEYFIVALFVIIFSIFLSLDRKKIH